MNNTEKQQILNELYSYLDTKDYQRFGSENNKVYNQPHKKFKCEKCNIEFSSIDGSSICTNNCKIVAL
jgi:transposase-like protein